MSFQNSEKICDIWEQYNVSGNNIGKKDDAVFLNNETIDLYSKKNNTDSAEFFLIDAFSFEHIIFYDLPVINNKFSILSSPLNLTHSLFLFTGNNFHPNPDLLSNWENETQNIFGFPLFTVPLRNDFNFFSEINKIIRFSAPLLNSEWMFNSFNKTWPADTFENTIRNYFGIREIKHPVLLFQYAENLFLKYCFHAELNTDTFLKALHESKELIDRFFSSAIELRYPSYPIERPSLLQFNIDAPKNAEPDEEYPLPNDAADFLEKFSFQYSSHDKMNVFILMLREIIKSQPKNEPLKNLEKNLTKLVKHSRIFTKPSKIEVDANNSILLNQYDMEIKMQPLHKAVYILFLNHPTGIHLNDLDTHRDELIEIYTKVATRNDPEIISQTIDDLLDFSGNKLYECFCRIKDAFVRELDDRIADAYYITGPRGGVKRIAALDSKEIIILP